MVWLRPGARFAPSLYLAIAVVAGGCREPPSGSGSGTPPTATHVLPPPPSNGGASGSAPDSQIQSTPVVVRIGEQKQDHDFWCWAATASMITQWLDPAPPQEEQCDYASDGLGRGAKYCCGTPLPSGCDRTEWPDFIAHGFAVTIRRNEWPEWSAAHADLSASRPFALTEQYPQSGGAHMFVATGAATVEDGRQMLEVYDPAASGDHWWHDYEDYRTNDKSRQMGRVYYKIQRSQSPTCRTEQGQDACGGNVNAGLTLPALGSQAAQAVPPPSNAEMQEASEGIVRKLGSVHPESLGFASADKAQTARIEFTRYGTQELDVRALSVSNPETLTVLDVQRELYEYKVDGAAMGFAFAVRHGGAWRPVRFGGVNTAKDFSSAESSLQGAPLPHPLPHPPPHPPQPATPPITVIEVPALSLFILKRGNRYSPARRVGTLFPGTVYSAKDVARAMKPVIPKGFGDIPESKPF